MINKILPFLNKLIPTKLAYDALQKANPKLKKFATGAIAAGYTIDETMDFLRDRFMPQEQESKYGNRPDEQAAAREVKESNRIPKAIATGASLAGGALGGLATLGMGGEDQGRGVMPSEITQGQPQRSPAQIGNRQPLGITEQPRAGVPAEGSTIVPPISSEQQAASKKKTATQKFGKHQQKKKMVDELYDMYQAGKYPPEPNQQPEKGSARALMNRANQQQQQINPEDQALLQAIQQVLQM